MRLARHEETEVEPRQIQVVPRDGRREERRWQVDRVPLPAAGAVACASRHWRCRAVHRNLPSALAVERAGNAVTRGGEHGEGAALKHTMPGIQEVREDERLHTMPGIRQE